MIAFLTHFLAGSVGAFTYAMTLRWLNRRPTTPEAEFVPRDPTKPTW